MPCVFISCEFIYYLTVRRERLKVGGNESQAHLNVAVGSVAAIFFSACTCILIKNLMNEFLFFLRIDVLVNSF